MKKLLNLLGLLTITGVSLSSTTACSSFIPGFNPNPPTPNPPVTHDIPYYQKEISDYQKEITQIQSDIKDMNSKEMKEQICGSNSMCKELQQLINSSTAELKNYQAIIQDDQYQILVLQTKGNFSLSDKLEAIKYLKNEITLLTERKTLMLNDSDYSKDDLKKVDNQILLVTKELAKIVPSMKGVAI